MEQGKNIKEIKDKVISAPPVQEKNTTVITMTDGVLIPKKGNKHLFTSWRLTFWGSLVLLISLCVFKKDLYGKIFLYIITGMPTTFECTIFAIMGAIELIRGIPLLVQLMFLYYALGSLIHIEGMVAAITALSICFGAYMGEIIRAGIQSIPKGQTEAARALGLSKSQTFFSIILPQTIKVVLPAIGNEFISMLKDSSLVSILALSDILKRGREYISRTFLSLQTMLVVALVYLILTLILSRLVGLMEERLHKNG